MINWTEEDVKFITKAIVLPCFESFLGEQLKLDEQSIEMYMKMIDSVSDKISERIREVEYDRYRDRSFFMSFLSQMHGISLDTMTENYNSYCNEYDKLNKHLLEASNK